MKTKLSRLKLQVVAVVLAAMAILVNAAHAELVYGVGGTGETATSPVLFSFDSLTPGTIVSIGAITLGAGQSLEGIAFSPSGTLYALGYVSASGASQGNAQLYTVNLSTGATTAVNMTPTNIGFVTGGAGTFSFGLAFTPSGNALQVIDAIGDIFQLNPATGALLAGGSTLNYPAANTPPNTPQFVGLAFGVDGRLRTIDHTNNLLGTQDAGDPTLLNPAPNGLGITTLGARTMGFDISIVSGIAYLQSDTDSNPNVQDEFFTVNLATGTATLIGAIGTDPNFNTIDVAVFIPEPSTYGLLGVGAVFGVVSIWRSRRSRVRV